MEFVNGFESWHETHYEIVSMMSLAYEKEVPEMERLMEENGTGGLYDKAFELTQRFEKQNKDRVWDGEFIEEIEKFFTKEIKLF